MTITGEWKSGNAAAQPGAAWIFDKDGHYGWKWMVEPIPDTPRQKPVIAPPSKVNVRTEQL